MPKNPAYKELAKYYDLINSSKDYKNEARLIKSLIKKYKKSTGNHLLDVACGTGKHILYLKDSFSILGTDLNQEMLDVAEENIPDVSFKQADMLHLNLNKKFDVIICLFGAIAFMKNERNLDKAISHFAKHLNHGGIVIIEPWLNEPEYAQIIKKGISQAYTIAGGELYISVHYDCMKSGKRATFDKHHLISEKNKKVKYFIERIEKGLFDKNKMLAMMKKHGLKAEFQRPEVLKDRGLYIGVKQAD